MNENLTRDFHVYPTVSAGIFHVEFPGGSGTISILDITGRLIRQPEVISETRTVHIDNPGIYILRLESEGISRSVKVINVR